MTRASSLQCFSSYKFLFTNTLARDTFPVIFAVRNLLFPGKKVMLCNRLRKHDLGNILIVNSQKVENLLSRAQLFSFVVRPTQGW